jgi:Calcineurin-like phosphoesterase.
MKPPYTHNLHMRLTEPPVVEHLSVPTGQRLLAVSDIHGNLPYLKGLLQKCSFSKNDTLIIVGDILEKGPESLGTLRYVMNLCRQFDVHPICGNCDFWQDFCDNEPDAQMDAWYRQYLVGKNKGWGDGLIAQMLHGLNFPIAPDMDLLAAKNAVRDAYSAEFSFLRALPHILETDDFVFVHGGYVPERGAFACMKLDEYRYKARPHDKWTVVGHWPVVLYRQDITNANPIIDEDLRLVSIDGGCTIKDDGQLNAFIMQDRTCISYDPFPVRRVRTAQAPNTDPYYIRHGDNRVRMLMGGEEFSLCEHTRTGHRMDILTKYILRPDGEDFIVNDCTDYRLPLEPGDEVSIVEETSRGYLCKHNGISGWYYGQLE